MQSILGNSRKPDLIFSASGRIEISARIAKLLGMRCGDAVDILSDRGEYYLYMRHAASLNGRHEAVVYRTNRRGSHFRAASKKLCDAILTAAGVTEKARLFVGEPVDDSQYGMLLPIITRCLL